MWPAIIAGVSGIAAAAAARPKDPKQKQPIKTAIALGIGAAVAYGLYKLVGKEIQEAVKENKNKKLYEKEKDPKVNLSYKPTQYITWADKLEDATNGTNWFDGTDEEAIYKVIRNLKNNNDWLELNKAYGMRAYYDVSPEFILGKDTNMVKMLQLELDTTEKEKVNSILKSKGIKYRI